jgi:predicted DsbA family dithiol-disulfide isomerase
VSVLPSIRAQRAANVASEVRRDREGPPGLSAFPVVQPSVGWGRCGKAVCADEQGKFSKAYKALFRNAQIGEVIQQLPASLALAADRFTACLPQRAKRQVEEDIATAAPMNIGSTPVFLVGTVERDGRVKVREIVRGAKPLADFERAIDEAIRATDSTVAK